jgi:predicted transcriptional regulator
VTSSEQRSDNDDAVGRFIESFALLMTESGIPRMPARVFVALMATESGALTAAELAERLRVSPAAISGAVRYLTQVGMVAKEREPGERRDHYRLYDDVFYGTFAKRDRLLRLWAEAAEEGIRAVGPETKAGARLAEVHDFFTFLAKEMPSLLEAWNRQRGRA